MTYWSSGLLPAISTATESLCGSACPAHLLAGAGDGSRVAGQNGRLKPPISMPNSRALVATTAETLPSRSPRSMLVARREGSRPDSRERNPAVGAPHRSQIGQ